MPVVTDAQELAAGPRDSDAQTELLTEILRQTRSIKRIMLVGLILMLMLLGSVASDLQDWAEDRRHQDPQETAP